EECRGHATADTGSRSRSSATPCGCISASRLGNRRVYETFDAALARFRLMPEQPCENPFIVEFIGRHSLRRAEDGWVWKFDSEAMGSRRFGEPVREYLQAVGCRAALILSSETKPSNPSLPPLNLSTQPAARTTQHRSIRT